MGESYDEHGISGDWDDRYGSVRSHGVLDLIANEGSRTSPGRTARGRINDVRERHQVPGRGRLAVAAAEVGIAVNDHSASPQSLTQTYAGAAERIVGAALVDRTAWERLATLCDHFPRRLCGSEALEGAIRWAAATMAEDGLENIRAEPVTVPHWVRGRESAELIAPLSYPLVMLGLGGSVGTPPDGITAEVLTVESFAELEAAGKAARGRIVLFNAPFTTYGATVPYRIHGPAKAARQGAVVALVRSVGPGGLRTPHTGSLSYEEGVPPIPAAAVTVEDAEMLHRIQRRGERARVRLCMEARSLPDALSANVIGELRGRDSEAPGAEEIVLIGAHLDSWDVSPGATDDGAGCIVTWEAARLLRRLELRPRRTVRVVLFTNEEYGCRGALGYRDAHEEELPRHVLALEVDCGAGRPLGFGLTAGPEGLVLAREIAGLLTGVGADRVWEGGGGADVNVLRGHGVPTMGLRSDESLYWQVHHTPADTLDRIDPADLARSVAAVAVMAYGVAEMPEALR